MDKRENTRRAIRFERPDYIPVIWGFNASSWDFYDQGELFDAMEAHPLLFPGYKRPEGRYRPYYRNLARKDEPYVDDFGCLWRANVNGITGAVVKHPLDTWDKFPAYVFPDPAVCTGRGPIDWKKTGDGIKAARAEGKLTSGGLMHGHTFLNLCNIRGYANLMYDFADEEPRISSLIDGIEAFHTEIVKRYAALGVDMMNYPEDLGAQQGPLLSPEHFRRYIKPSYTRMVAIARDAGCLIHMHSDGDVRELVKDIMDAGIQVLNIQDLVNGVDWIRDNLKGKVCIDLDIDRQKIIPHGSPGDIDNHVRDIVEKLGTKEGGLMMRHDCLPGIPMENIRALMDAMEKYAFL